MALKECGLAFWADSMASRNGAGRFVRDESAALKHAALSVGRRMFVLGGVSAGGILDDVQVLFSIFLRRDDLNPKLAQVFHAERGVWLQLGCGSVPSLYSPSRSIPVDARGPRCVGHCLAFWETKLLVIGGRIEPKSKKLRAFALDLESQSWSVLAPEGEVPVARTGQSVVQVGSSLIIFGGEDSKGQMLNDLHILNLKTLVWRPPKTSGSKPSPRRGHSAVCYNERYMLVYGGKAQGNYYNDIYVLDLQNMEWSKEKPRGTVPSPRAGHAGVMVGSKWYIVGGEYKGGEVLETMAFNVDSGNWQTVTTVQPGTPLANDGISLVKVRTKGKVFLLVFGGHGAILSNQIFVMMISNSSKTVPVVSKRDEIIKELHDDFSASSLPFSFTSGSLNARGLDQNQPPQGADNSAVDVIEELESSVPSLSSEGDSLSTRPENKQQQLELAEALTRALTEKQEIEKRLEEALILVEELKLERKGASSLNDQRNTMEEGSGSSKDKDIDEDDLQEQLRESQQQIVFAVRKQAVAERKLLGALRENRELRKKLLHQVQV
ncbi:acyl-CoA-binding domain-containing protein 5 [Selaginella moellendorffii]|uniref:acyl-CoA-binding domain-containing protein 5 n=1 Tax=Selaginella moellendorffii TaxID=88036 RepID=UPI000D1C334C|nr:acyl-CoA-binding domain-containing protein 5 [Selaginella moellendorffii]|eukprot:XP_024516934.1 acyl-CoA-binding domain-containing protein 5 [Selaginella moellendorffii]